MNIVNVRGHVIGVWSWADGFRKLQVPTRCQVSEADILAQALWLEIHVSPEVASEYLDSALASLRK